MLFHIFSSQEERRAFGGSDFIELQYCLLRTGTQIEKIVSVDSVDHWKNDSLYIFGDDVNEFINHYGKIFYGGTYSNMETGFVDPFGINYYTPKQADTIIKKIAAEKLCDYQILLKWMENVNNYNGFYILGE